MAISSTDERNFKAAMRRWPWAGLVAVFVLMMFTGTAHNDFPYIYHRDEPGKVKQVLTHRYNFHHPLLMLEVDRRVWRIMGSPRDPQTVVEIGRWVSAFFTALAAAGAGLLAWRALGWAGLVGTGGLFLLQPHFFVLAHFMKEDPTLVGAMALTIVMAAIYRERGGMLWAGMVGAAAGLAISAKYVGAIMVGLALIAVVAAAVKDRRWKPVFVFVLACVAVTLFVNRASFLRPDDFGHGLNREVGATFVGHRGIAKRDVPHVDALRLLWDSVPMALYGPLLALGAVAFWRSLKWKGSWLLLSTGVIYLGSLSFTPELNSRYLLPVEFVMTLLAGVGVGQAFIWVAGLQRRRGWGLMPLVRTSVAGGLSIALAGALWGWYQPHYDAVRGDQRLKLAAWINETLPGDAVVIQGQRCALRDPNYTRFSIREKDVQRELITVRTLAEYDSVSALREEGVTHVVAAGGEFDRYLRERPSFGSEEARLEYERRRAFYEELIHGYEPIWDNSDVARGGILNHLMTHLAVRDIREAGAVPPGR